MIWPLRIAFSTREIQECITEQKEIVQGWIARDKAKWELKSKLEVLDATHYIVDKLERSSTRAISGKLQKDEVGSILTEMGEFVGKEYHAKLEYYEISISGIILVRIHQIIWDLKDSSVQTIDGKSIREEAERLLLKLGELMAQPDYHLYNSQIKRY